MSSKGTRSTLALAVIVIILIAALGGTVYYYSSRPSVAPSSMTTSAVVPTPGFVGTGTYVAEGGNQFQWLDPAVSYYQYDYEILNQQFETLLWYNYNSTTQIIPWLATDYSKVTPTQYVFHLRQNITFQDGTPFNARAVWFSLNRLLIMDGTSGTGDHGTQAAWIVQQMLNTSLSSALSVPQPYDAHWVQEVLGQNFVQIVDPYTVNLNIMTPTTQFPFLLSNEWADIVSPSFVVSHDFPSACATSACPADTINYTAYFDHIAGDGLVKDNYLDLPTAGSKAGTGPYYIDSVNPTTYEVVMKANPNYWGGPSNWSGPPIKVALKELDFEYVPDLATRLLDAKAGKATAIGVASTDIYSVADRTQWSQYGRLVSIVPGMTLYGPYPQFVTDWFNFLTNVTSTSGKIQSFQPFADLRWRLAVGDSVNMTDAQITINNRLGAVANNLIPPGLAPAGAYDPTLPLPYSYNLTEMGALITAACKNPLTSFVDDNGHPYAAGVINNSCNPSNPQTIGLYVGAGDETDQRILTIMAENLNTVSSPLGVTFTIIPVPGGEYYTLASEHQIYFYWGGWVADYNYVIDWLPPMLTAGGSYPAWNNMNYTVLNNLWQQAHAADAKGDVATLVTVNHEMQVYANNAAIYIYIDYPLEYFFFSSYLQGFYWNEAMAVPYFASCSYSQTPM
jgi:ABC-type transport system substrate-binding protein